MSALSCFIYSYFFQCTNPVPIYFACVYWDTWGLAYHILRNVTFSILGFFWVKSLIKYCLRFSFAPVRYYNCKLLEIHMYSTCLANLHYINILFTHVWCHIFYIVRCHIFRKYSCDHSCNPPPCTLQYPLPASSMNISVRASATGTACSVSSFVAKQFCSHFQEEFPDLVIHCKKVS